MALTQRQTQELKGTIEQRRRALLEELRDDIVGEVGDPGDESVATLIADLDHADVGRDLTELRGLEAARGRIAEGSYGVCAQCGGDIGFERLRANPAAVRCVDCQRVHERTHADGAGGSSL